MFKKLLVLVLIPLAIFLTQISFFYYQYVSVSIVDKPTTIVIDKGSSLRHLAQKMATQNLIRHPWFFEAIIRLSGRSQQLQSGEYHFDAGITEQQILAKLLAGDVIKHYVTIVEGTNLSEILATLNDNPYITHDAEQLTNAQVAKQLGINQDNPEGWFFPDTYQFLLGAGEMQILQRAYRRMQKTLDQQWQQRAPGLPYRNAYQALIVASMVVKEAHLESERPIIAGVILRRLKKRMRLQIDPTVIYGLGDNYRGRLYRADLRRKTPYNTYVIYGLPPTPIASPGEASIHAALHPDDSNALYFVARGDGSHVFSSNLHEHRQAVDRYILKKG